MKREEMIKRGLDQRKVWDMVIVGGGATGVGRGDGHAVARRHGGGRGADFCSPPDSAKAKTRLMADR